jgi:hypothetical protein
MIPLGRSVSPGTSAIVAVIVHTWVAELKKQMQEAGADVMTEQISADIAAVVPISTIREGGMHMRSRRGVRRTSRRTARRVHRRHRRRRRRRILVGGMVVLAVGGAAYGAVKLTQKDTGRIEEYSGSSVEEMTEEELVAAMKELGIQSIDLSDADKAALASETTTAAAAAQPEPSYLDELERLASLRDQGVITEEEFAAKKDQLLGL